MSKKLSLSALNKYFKLMLVTDCALMSSLYLIGSSRGKGGAWIGLSYDEKTCQEKQVLNSNAWWSSKHFDCKRIPVAQGSAASKSETDIFG